MTKNYTTGGLKLFKRALSFIIILASVVILSYTLFAGNLFSGLIGTSKTSSYSYDYSVDKKGNIYYIQNGSDGQKDMIGLDSSGRQFCKKSIASVAGVDNVVDSIYVTQDDTLLMVVYHLMPGTEYFDNVTVDQFRDDGSFAGQVFQKTISKRYDGKYRVISSMSDDDNSIYFGVLNDSQIITYSVKKSTGVLQQSANLRLSVNPNNINAFLVLPSEDVVMSLSGGLIVKETAESAVQNYTFSGNPQVIITNFWYAGEQFYCRDEVSGNLYLSLDGELNPSCVMQGEKDISSGKGTKFSQLNDIAVGTSGNLIGVSNSNGVSHIYDGGLEFFPEVAQTDNSQSGSLTLWLLFFGVAAGIVILSLLIWDFYCNVLHMQISLLFRQTLLVFFVLYCSIYLLSNFMIKPETSKAFNGGNQTEVEQYVQTVSDMFQSSLTTSGSKQLDSTIVNDFFTRFASTQKNENALKSVCEKRIVI
jgi:hypothetical protein